MGYIRRLRSFPRRLVLAAFITIFTAVLVVTLQLRYLKPSWATASDLPPLQPHPLPSTLASWVDASHSGDYFRDIRPSPAGYLVWFDFPIKVHIEHPPADLTDPAKLAKFQEWIDNVRQGIEPWKAYLPIDIVEKAEGSDIIVLRIRPPLQLTANGPRARSAEVRYQVYLRNPPNSPAPVLYPKYNISISPDLSANYIKAASLHEMGHALGIWGHSRSQADALYFTQVRNPPPISPRDINTLKLIYQQPTRLGWSIPALGAKGSNN